MPQIRPASHAGSWYTDDEWLHRLKIVDEGAHLEKQITLWLNQVEEHTERPAKVIISPHAGFRYSGHVMAHAYAQIQAENVRKIFLLGPSHHHFTRECLVSRSSAYNTPHGPVQIATDICAELVDTGQFSFMPADVDEAEHSLELQLPYIWHMMRKKSFKLVPIMIGALHKSSQRIYGEILARYFDDPQSLFIISSDFCHWGHRFQYTFHDETKGDIHECIEWLDRQGMDTIISGNAEEFSAYLRKYNNTICGRYPIAILLQILRFSHVKLDMRLLKYDQSARIKDPSESSVSYIAAVGMVGRSA